MNNYKEKLDNLLNKILTKEEYLSYSSLSQFKKSPKDFVEYKFGERKETDAMAYGTLLHTLVLQPETIDSKYAVYDDADICASIGGAKPRATKLYKEDKAIFEAQNQGKLIISLDDFNEADKVANNVKFNRSASSIIKQCTEFEKGYEWEFMNLKFKGFIDAKGDKCMFDLKAQQMPSLERFKGMQ